MWMILLANVFQEVKCRGTADCTATAWLMRPIAAPRMGHIGQKFEAPGRLNDPLEGANGYRSMVPRSSATDASSPLPVLFRRSPRQAGTVRPRLTSKMVWTLKKPKSCALMDSTPTTPQSSRR